MPTKVPDESNVPGSRPGSDYHEHLTSEHYNEALYDYSLGNGVQMRRPYEHGFPGSKNPDNYHRDRAIADERIQHEITNRLSADHLTKGAVIEVLVRDGVVYLRGTVDDRPSKREAEHCAEAVAGVRDVFNELRLSKMHLL